MSKFDQYAKRAQAIGFDQFGDAVKLSFPDRLNLLPITVSAIFDTDMLINNEGYGELVEFCEIARSELPKFYEGIKLKKESGQLFICEGLGSGSIESDDLTWRIVLRKI